MIRGCGASSKLAGLWSWNLWLEIDQAVESGEGQQQCETQLNCSAECELCAPHTPDSAMRPAFTGAAP